jgi:hypothetical protein
MCVIKIYLALLAGPLASQLNMIVGITFMLGAVAVTDGGLSI